MPLCPLFTKRVQEFQATLKVARSLLEEYGQSGEPQIATQIREMLTRLRQDREAFVNGEYMEGVKRVVENKDTNRPPFMIDAVGRIVESRSISLMAWISDEDRFPYGPYLPHLVRRLGTDLSLRAPDRDLITDHEFNFLEEIHGGLSTDAIPCSFNRHVP